MIKIEDLLDAYDNLCLCTRQKIEAIFIKAGKKELAAEFRDNWMYVMNSEVSLKFPKTLNRELDILDASGKPVDLQTIIQNMKESHVFLRLSHLMLDYNKPISILPGCSKFKSSNPEQYKKITFYLNRLNLMAKSYRDLQDKLEQSAETQQDVSADAMIVESPELQVLGEFSKFYFWLGDSLAPIREKYAKLSQGDKRRYKLLREKESMRIELYKKYWKEGLSDMEIFKNMNSEELKLLREGKTTRQCTISSYRVWKSRVIKSGKLSKKYLKK